MTIADAVRCVSQLVAFMMPQRPVVALTPL